MKNIKRIFNLVEMRNSIVEWGYKNIRKFPWRETDDAYRILIAEIFLQRTSVNQVIPVYKNFIRKYPDMNSFLGADAVAVKKIILPLGLKHRAERLLKMRDFLKNINGKIPRSKEELLKIPGVSDYTAGAVRICAFNTADTPLDTNTVRITGRVFGLEINDYSRKNCKFSLKLSKLISKNEPAKSFYALIDIGSTVCIKKSPLCVNCPLKKWCIYKVSAI